MSLSGPALALVALLASPLLAGEPGLDLVPEEPGTTPSYWCTWTAQGNRVSGSTYGADMEVPHDRIALEVNEASVLGASGWARTLYPRVRGDLYLLLDLGWDVAAETKFDRSRWRLGRIEVADDKFPCCAATGAGGLSLLDGEVKAAGWRGVGLWIAAQAPGDGRDGTLRSDADVEAFFRERLRWSREAGIRYWKVDYGARGHDIGFRRKLTRLAREEAPELLVEHARGGGPLNDDNAPWETGPAHRSGRFRRWGDGEALARSIEILRFAQVFRTYDVTAVLSVPTTLDRVAELLRAVGGHEDVTGLVNCEDEPYIAAGLGLAMGIMRYPIPPRAGFVPRVDEVTRAVRWQRLAPAFAAGAVSTLLSGRVLMDRWRFAAGDSWATWLVGQELPQGAPAVVARGLPLPRVEEDGDPPYVVASRHPNGAVAVATLPRRLPGRGEFLPRADVAVEVGRPRVPIGVFGEYRSLTLHLGEGAECGRIWAQDLAGDAAVDVTSRVLVRGSSLTLPGDLIDDVGRTARSADDASRPGLVIVVE